MQGSPPALKGLAPPVAWDDHTDRKGDIRNGISVETLVIMFLMEYSLWPVLTIALFFLPVLRILYVYPRSRIRIFSILDPGSEFFPSWIPDPNFFPPGSQIRIKELKYFNPKKGF